MREKEGKREKNRITNHESRSRILLFDWGSIGRKERMSESVLFSLNKDQKGQTFEPYPSVRRKPF